MIGRLALGSPTVFHLNDSHEISWNFDPNKRNSTTTVVKCGNEYQQATLGLSFYADNIYQFVRIEREIQVVVYSGLSKHIHYDRADFVDQTIDRKIYINLYNGSRFKLAEIDESLAKFLRRFDRYNARAVALVENKHYYPPGTTTTALFAFLYQIDNNLNGDDHYNYGYRYSTFNNLTIGDWRNCVFNPKCPLTFASIIMINTKDEIFLLTTKIDDDSRKYLLQNSQLNQTIGYVCMMKHLKDHMELSRNPCDTKYHNISGNDRLIPFEFGFVYDNQLYLMNMKMNE
ncbi:hypothetical protein BLA29_007675, partial [Euroglyphus maynei]